MEDASATQHVSQTVDKDTHDAPLISSFSDPDTGRETWRETLEGVGVDVLLLQATNVLSHSNTEENSRELRELVEKLVDKVKVLAKTLSRLQESQAELQTSLTVTSSNLTLALSNTEMLEEALKRAGGGGGKDLGWRRWSDREGAGLLKRSSASASIGGTATVQEQDESSIAKRAYHSANGTESGTSSSRAASPTPDHLPLRPSLDVIVPQRQGSSSVGTTPSAISPAPPSISEGRFFKFRFGGGSATSSLASNTFNILNGTSTSRPPSSSGPTARAQGSHLASASLPSLAATLVPNLSPAGDHSYRDDSSDSHLTVASADQHKQRVEALEKLLASEREAREEALAEKTKIEGEVESLTAVLFEEANKMVAIERRRVAEIEEELQIVRDEREAFRGALKVVELENLGRKEREERALSPSTDSVTSVAILPSIDSTPESVFTFSTPRSTASSSMIPQPRSRLRSPLPPSSIPSPSQAFPSHTSRDHPPPKSLDPTSASANPIISSPIPRLKHPQSLKPSESNASSMPALASPLIIPPSPGGSLQRDENGIVISHIPFSPSKARTKTLTMSEGDPDVDDQS